MRILQLIDSLEAGGAERVALNYANALVGKVAFSGLVATRAEGPLLSQLRPKVAYLFLHKKRKLDLAALFRLRKFVVANRVTHLQAHSTSFFTAFLLKLIRPSLIVVRHDHYGNNEFLAQRPAAILRLTAPFFAGVIVVNQLLKEWSEKKLASKKVLYLPNFTFENEKNPSVVTRLKGTTGKRVILLANLRPQKNHLMLLAVASKLQVSHPDWTFHLVGKDFEDDYALEIKRQIKKLHLENQVFLYGSRTDVGAILQQSTIGVLTSVSEGLPVAVLEYGAHRLPVVVTGVGALPTMIQNGVNGFVVPSQDAEAFGTALTTLIQQDALRDRLAEAFHATINESFAAAAIVDRYLAWLEKG